MKTYRDHYFKQAKKDNYPARSVYKLKEIQDKLGILKPGQRVLDLGASPGSWSLRAAEILGPSGRVLAVDLQPAGAAFPETVTFLQEDVFTPGPALAKALDAMGPFDVVLSDMAPNTTGHKFTDQARSQDLCDEALRVALARLKKGGALVLKIFQGPDTKGFTDALRRHFATVKIVKPKSSRPESKEIFIVGLGLTNRGDAPGREVNG